MKDLKKYIEELYDKNGKYDDADFKQFTIDFLHCLSKGEARAAEPDKNNEWKVNIWIKKGIILLFKFGKLSVLSIDSKLKYFDKDTLPLHHFTLEDEVRIVPGGSSIREGSYIAKGVICMPPMFVNIGAYVDEGSMIDSHALVGSCAQVGKRVHISAASQIGGVLEPPGARPVIVEDDVLVGGNCGVYEGVLVRRRAVLGSGVILTSSTKVYDLVNEKIISSTKDNPLEIPESAVLIPGSRLIDSPFAKKHGLSIQTPLILKYRDEKTDAKTALENALR